MTDVDIPAFRVLSLCTGIGGIELGLGFAGRRLGIRFRTVCMVEREAYAAAVLAYQMEQGRLDACPIWTDIKTFPEIAHLFRGKVDLITGGYPCQPFSAAGRRKGTDDPRHIFPDIYRVIEKVRPSLCFFENVGGHLSCGFPEVYRSLRSLGYSVEAGLFSAAEIGASHKRERLFILGNAKSLRRRSGSVPLGVAKAQPELEGSNDTVGNAKSRSECRQHENKMGAGTEAEDRWQTHHNEPYGSDEDLPEFPPGPSDPRWADIIQARPDLAPAIKCEVRGMDAGISHWMDRVNTNRVDRLRALGNAVVPLVAATAFIALLERVLKRGIDYVDCDSVCPLGSPE